MSGTTGHNQGILSRGNNSASSLMTVNHRLIFSIKKVPSGYSPSLSVNNKTSVSGDRDQGAKINDLQNSKQDSNPKTIENWLHRFGKHTILSILESSLEQVKRNKTSSEIHHQLSKSIDKELQKLSIAFHPDRAGDTEWQAALNAIRKVLKTLTEVFLENIFIDYKYEYFSRLNVSLLVDEMEMNDTIQTIFYKIRMFSEAKRMNIVGEIRKFLIESEKCVMSFLEDRESDFLKYRDYALYHLRKNIEGYKKLERDYNLLIEECSNEHDSLKTVVQNMVDQSLREWRILRKLEQSAKSSFQGNYEIFPVNKNMDKYYVLPFVDYVNVLSMCSLLMTPKRSSFFSFVFSWFLPEVDYFSTDDKRTPFIKAYILAFDIYMYKKEHKNGVHIPHCTLELRYCLKTIFTEVLQTEYTVDVYQESYNRKTEILDLKHFVECIEEKGKTFIENLNQYVVEKKKSSESDVNYRQDEEGSFEVGAPKEIEIGEVKKINLLTEREKSKYKMERNEFPESVLNYRQEERKSSKVDVKIGEKESEEHSRKLGNTSPLEDEKNQCKMETQKVSKSVLNCIQDENESLEVDMINGEKRNEDSKELTVNLPISENEREIYSSNSNSLSEGKKIPGESQVGWLVGWEHYGLLFAIRGLRESQEIETSESMSGTTGRNQRIPSFGNNSASSSTTLSNRLTFSKKKVPSGFCPSLSANKKTSVNGDRDQGAKVNYLQNSRQDSNPKTIENLLHRFGKPTILPILESSLEQLKRNKITPESHEKLLKSIDKELQKLSIAFHPDRAGDTEWQAALNAIRVVLKTLTEVFLENIFMDYKYEYFSSLDVRVLVNENERNNTIQTIFYKISVFSETKRMNIIGEIRKFLIESEKCVTSFREYNESNFLKFRDCALYHLRKNIEGYKKLEREYNLLIEECSKEDESIRTVVQNMVDQTLREWRILRKLEQSAKSSFQGNFEIFPVQENMDEYYVLPFVDYVNVLSMCSLLLMPKRSRFSLSLPKEENFSTDDKRTNFISAYILAYDINQYKIDNIHTRKNLAIKDYSQKLRETLCSIFSEVLQKNYTVDVYKEGKSNRAEMYEKHLSDKNILKDLEEKEKAFGEHLRQYQMENNEFPESVVNYRQEKRKSSKVDTKIGEKKSEEDSTKCTSPLEDEENQCKMETQKVSKSVLNCNQDENESLEVDMINGEKRNEDSKELTVNLPISENEREIYSSNSNSLSEGKKIPGESQESEKTWLVEKDFVVIDEVGEECYPLD